MPGGRGRFRFPQGRLHFCAGERERNQDARKGGIAECAVLRYRKNLCCGEMLDGSFFPIYDFETILSSIFRQCRSGRYLPDGVFYPAFRTMVVTGAAGTKGAEYFLVEERTKNMLP